MGISPATFSSAGKTSQHYIPGVYSRSKNVGSGTGVSSGNLAIIGASTGGEPLKLLAFSDKSEAQETLISGNLLDGVAHAFAGSKSYTPQNVYAVRVNAGTKSKRSLFKGSSKILEVESAGFGTRNNLIKLRFDESQASGYEISVSYKDNTLVVDSVEKPSLSILYTGENSTAKCTIGNGKMTLSSFAESVETEKVQINFSEFDTLDALVSRINNTDVYVATLIDVTPNTPSSELDAVENVSIAESSATVFHSDLQAIIDALKSIQFIGDVTLASNAERLIPDTDSGYVYFSGAENGTDTVADYINALEVLEKEDIQIIATPSTNANVIALIADHCAQMSSISQKKERTFWVGLAAGTTIDSGISSARGLNTELGSLVITGGVATNPVTGNTETISPALLACKCAGMESAIGLSMPLTNKAINVSAFSEKYSKSDLEKMIKNGIVPFGTNDNGELVCIRNLTTYQGDSLINNERSMIRSVLYMDRDLRKAFSSRVGTNDAPSESEIIQVLKAKAAEWYSMDLITKSDSGDNVFNVKVRFDGDKTYLSFDRYIRAPNNFMFITSTNRVYSSSVEI